MKIAIIADELTSKSLSQETKTKRVTPTNYKFILKFWKPDFLFVESAWRGYKNEWKFKIASYPDYPERNNHSLQKVIKYAKKLGIPTVFWNKEDGVHFDRFVDSAMLFDHIFTVDENCIERYRSVVEPHVTVETMMFAVQPKTHHMNRVEEKINRACFVGSYTLHEHKKRREWQKLFFSVADKIDLKLDVYDRHLKKGGKTNIPKFKNITVYSAIPHEKTAEVYQKYLISFNVNTVEDSSSMFSRRLIEIIACGGFAITNNTKAVEKYFKDYCFPVDNEDDLVEVLTRLISSPTLQDHIKAKKGSEYVLKHHTWEKRLLQIKEVIDRNA